MNWFFSKFFNRWEVKWTEECLMIIDMQPKFLSRNSEIITKVINKLTKNIINELDEFKDNGFDIILVECDWYWDTIPEIRKTIWKYNHKLLRKTTTWLLSPWNKYLKSDNSTISILKNADSLVNLAWVNATWCVMSTAHWFYEIQINTLLKLKNTLSVCDYDESDFCIYNKSDLLLRCFWCNTERNWLSNISSLNSKEKSLLQGDYSKIDITGYDPDIHKYVWNLS